MEEKMMLSTKEEEEEKIPMCQADAENEPVLQPEEAGVLRDNRGVGVVEVILILVVLIALVLIFKEQLGSMVEKAMKALEKSMNEVLS